MSLEQQLAENTAAILALTAALQGLSTLPTASTPVVQQQAKKSEADQRTASAQGSQSAAPSGGSQDMAADTPKTEPTTFDALKKDFLSLSTKVKDAAGNAFGGRAACEELLAKFGAAKLSNLVETQWAEAHAFVKDKLAV